METLSRRQRKRRRAQQRAQQRAAATQTAHRPHHHPETRLNITPGLHVYLIQKMPHVKDMVETLGSRVPLTTIEELKTLNERLAKLVKDTP